MSKHLKNIGVVSMLTMVSRVLGLVRESLGNAVFGPEGLLSAFVVAFQLPNLFRRLLAEGAFTAAFVPTLQDELHHRKEPGAFRLVNQAASWLLVASITVVVVSMLAIKGGLFLIQGGQLFSAEPDKALRWFTALRLSLLLFPYLIFVCLAAAFSAALQSLHRFVEPALSPIWLNLSMIGALAVAAYVFRSDDLGATMNWLCYGALFGGFLQMAVPAAALMYRGWRPTFDLRADPPVRQIGRLMVPTIFGSAIYLINMTVSGFFALNLNASARVYLNNSTRLMELPIGVFAIAISTVVFPLISKYASAGNWDQLAVAYRKGMRLILAVNVPAAVGLAVLAAPVIRVIYEHGKFAGGDTVEMTPVLMIYAAGLPFLAAVSLMLRAFYSRKDTKTPVIAATLSFLANLILSLALMRPLGTNGLAIASTVAVVVQAVFLQVRVVRAHPNLAFRHLVVDLLKIASASIIMGAAVYAGMKFWARSNPPGNLMDLIGLAVLVCGGGALYGGILWLLRIEGREELARMLARPRERV